MKKFIALSGLVALVGSTFAQESSRPIRIQIRRADPWFVKGMMEGQSLLSPELSTALNFMGLPNQVVNYIDRIFEGGVFIVNANDNSLWWIPGRPGGR